MKSWAYKWQVVASVIFGAFMVIMDATVVNVALPTLRNVFAASGGGSIGQVQWIISGFVLAIGIVTPMAGLLADRFGIKRVYLLSLFGFTVASALPLGTALLFSAFPPEERGAGLRRLWDSAGGGSRAGASARRGAGRVRGLALHLLRECADWTAGGERRLATVAREQARGACPD